MTRENFIYAFSMLCPWLAITWAASLLLWRRPAVAGAAPPASGIWRRLWLPLVTLGVVLMPLNGVALGRWIIGCDANFSIPLTLWLGLASFERLTDRHILAKTERTSCWVFGLVAGLLLYPMSLGLTMFDPYALGWKPGWLLTAVLGVIVLLLAKGNRFVVWLMAASLGYNLRLLESPNLWDYFVDPVYFIGSTAVAMACGGTYIRLRLTRILHSRKAISTTEKPIAIES